MPRAIQIPQTDVMVIAFVVSVVASVPNAFAAADPIAEAQAFLIPRRIQ